MTFVNGTVVGWLGSLIEESSVKVRLPIASKGINGVVGPGLMTVPPRSENSKFATRFSVKVRPPAFTTPGRSKRVAKEINI